MLNNFSIFVDEKYNSMTPAEILNLHRLKKTPIRLAILQTLLASGTPQSEMEFREKMTDIYDRITFYRTIQTLMESGVIHRIVADNTTQRYALNQCTILNHEHQTNHVHFYCKKCGKVECFQEIQVTNYRIPAGYLKQECEVVIKGFCAACTTK